MMRYGERYECIVGKPGLPSMIEGEIYEVVAMEFDPFTVCLVKEGRSDTPDNWVFLDEDQCGHHIKGPIYK